ncbi:MAG: Gamma-glutamyl cyclotransferase, AIG2-like, partial [Pseudomonadota bacterium]
MVPIQLFVYGTLLVPEVVSEVIGRLPEARLATLAGYARFRMVGKHYPGLRAESGVSTDGAVLSG